MYEYGMVSKVCESGAALGHQEMTTGSASLGIPEGVVYQSNT